MTPPPLPLEIYYKIMGHATDKKDLSALALCCTAFRDDAQRKMFCHPSRIAFDQQTAFFDAIIASPVRLGPMVKSYTICRIPNYPPAIELVRSRGMAALPLMCNLTTLRIYDAACITMASLLDCSFQLDALVFVWQAYDSSEIDALFFDFLRKQPSLRRLRIRGGSANTIKTHFLRDNPAWCPNLVSLDVEAGLMDIFLAKHRPIRHFDWFNALRSELTPPQSTHLFSLKYLSFSWHTLQANVTFFNTLQRMSSLVLLDVCFVNAGNLGQSRKLDFLGSTPQLRYLILTGYLTLSLREKPGPELARTAFKLCPTLEHIAICTSHPDDESKIDTFDRFYAPDASGGMGRSVMQTCDVYAWEVIE